MAGLVPPEARRTGDIGALKLKVKLLSLLAVVALFSVAMVTLPAPASEAQLLAKWKESRK